MKRRSASTEYMMIVLGTFIMGFAIKNMFDPINLVTGGVSGIAIILKEFGKVPLWISNTVLNIPLFLAAIHIKGWKFVKKTAIATASLSLSLMVLPEIPFLMEDLFLTSLFGGIVSGFGLGLVLMCQATTGGTDMLAALIQRKMKQYSIAEILQVIDGIIVLAGAVLFGIRFAMYALITIAVVTKVSDNMIEGLKYSKQAFIISDAHEQIAAAIMERMDRGVTGIDAMGMYSKEGKRMLYCVVPKKEIIQIKEIVSEFDKSAFVIVGDAREVLGEGFIEY